MKIKRKCQVCNEDREINLDEFMKSGKKRVVCGQCQDGVLITKTQAYDILYGSYFC